MDFNGTVNGGVVVPDSGARLPEGAKVRIEIVRRNGKRRRRIMRHAGTARSLPPDASRNLDHYLYGHDRR